MVAEVAASQAATALWALCSQPENVGWAKRIAADSVALHALRLACRRGQKQGTRARFNAARLLSAATLGALAIQGKLSYTLFSCASQ
jgi:hypothetical protein